jgi:DNA-binding response OmpR family regulator
MAHFGVLAPSYPRQMMHSGPGSIGVAPRILIVDDDPNLLVILADQLRADGYDVWTARDGEEALRRLAAAWPDLLIIDMLMPRMDGLTLAREVKARADLPIIVLSAIDTADSKADLLDEVAEDYVTKPALAANLGQTVATDTLLARGWADTEDADPSYVWVTMRRLRQKVELDPNKPAHLLTVRGIGYRLVGAPYPDADRT